MKELKRFLSKLGNPGSRFHNEGGFTLAELLVFISIMIIFMVGIGGMIQSGVDSSLTSYSLVKTEEKASEALSTMTRQIRVATYIDPTSSTSAILFAGDLDGNDTVDSMVFRVVNGNLMRGPDAGSLQAWVEGVDTLTFTYYRQNDTTKQLEVFAPGSVADWNELIRRIDMTIDLPFGDEGMTYKASVTLRNKL